MAVDGYEYYGLDDLYCVATGAALLGSGGGGSFEDALVILKSMSGWSGSVPVGPYDGKTTACSLAMMGSPDAATELTLDDIRRSFSNALAALVPAIGCKPQCFVPGEIGAINSLVPLIAAWERGLWVVDGDGAGRAVPELPQTTLAGAANLPAAPCALGNDAADPALIETAIINAPSAARVESLAGGVVAAFGSFAGMALWSSTADNQYALTGNYIPGTLAQTRAVGQFLLAAARPPSTGQVVQMLSATTGRAASVAIPNFYVTQVTQATSSASLDAGVIRLDNAPDPSQSSLTCYLYNLNENLIAYASASATPLIVAPDSICYYSEDTGRGFSNASSDLAVYYDFEQGKSTGKRVSVIKLAAAAQLCAAPGVLDSFAALLRQIGYAGALPSG